MNFLSKNLVIEFFVLSIVIDGWIDKEMDE